jgi:hypothetical protein
MKHNLRSEATLHNTDFLWLGVREYGYVFCQNYPGLAFGLIPFLKHAIFMGHTTMRTKSFGLNTLLTSVVNEGQMKKNIMQDNGQLQVLLINLALELCYNKI